MKSRTLLVALLGGALLVAGAIGAWTSASRGATPGDSNDPLTAARFEITVDGLSIGAFSDLAGIASGTDDVDYVNRGGDVVVKLPAKRTPPTVTLKRGMTRNLELAAWHELVMLGDIAAARKNVALTMYDPTGAPVARYKLTNAWPAKLEISALKAGASEVLMETVTLVCENLQRVSV